MRKIEAPVDTPTEFELGYTAADIQRAREKRKRGEMQEDTQKQQREERKEIRE